MRIEDFNERLKHSILVGDGAMGSLLYESVGPQRCVDELNTTHAEAVFHVHQTYIEAGAQLIETNTFSANRHKLSQFGMGGRVSELNHRAVKIAREAREAAKHEVLIAGSIGPLGIVQHVRELPHEEIVAIFKEQAGALEERGVDLFLLETFSDIEELIAAVDAIRSFSRLPIAAELTYSDEGSTFGGTRPPDAWERLKDKNIQTFGANCTIGPQLLLPVLRELAASAKLPLTAMPNAGFPKRVGDRIVYPKSSPEYFALFAQEAAEIGARILGGCCGTTPEHIRAMAEAVKKLHPGKSSAAKDGAKTSTATIEVFEPAERFRRIAAREPESKLWRKIQAQKFVTSVEIDPPKGVTIERILDQVGRVMASGEVDSIDINSGTLARVGMDALVLAGALKAHGFETIPHVTTRDANIIGLQAMLLGAWAVGSNTGTRARAVRLRRLRQPHTRSARRRGRQRRGCPLLGDWPGCGGAGSSASRGVRGGSRWVRGAKTEACRRAADGQRKRKTEGFRSMAASTARRARSTESLVEAGSLYAYRELSRGRPRGGGIGRPRDGHGEGRAVRGVPRCRDGRRRGHGSGQVKGAS